MTDTTNRPRVLIEDWLPTSELGIESRRERAVVTTIPPLNWLHVWWARRPLVASAAVVLAGLLPTWSQDLADAFPDANQLQTEKSYRSWLLQLVGIWGDPVTARKILDAANAAGEKLKGNGYGYKQAYRNGVGRDDVDLLHAVLRHTWGKDMPLVADPTAGGGSIPFTAARLGIPTLANDLNGVAASVLRAGIQIPSEQGADLVPHLKKWGNVLIKRVEKRLKPFFPLQGGESVVAYIWANAVTCPRKQRLVPLMPDKWLRREPGKEAAVELVTEDAQGRPLAEPTYRVVTGTAVDRQDAGTGTVARGKAISPYDSLVIDGEYIKDEAKAGRMRQVLYAVAIKTPSGERRFRAPTQDDRDALAAAEEEFNSRRDEWIAANILPTEEFPPPIPKHDIRPYGFVTWLDFFTARQLLVHGVFVEELVSLTDEIRAEVTDHDAADAVLFQLALMQGKALNWNSRLSSWNVGSQGMRSVFDRHDFGLKWTFAEFEGAKALYGWCFDRCLAAYSQICALLDGTGTGFDGTSLPRSVQIIQGSAADLSSWASGSVTHLCMDPPYYDNVMYAELADFFYVWEKRTLGRIVPDYFPDALSDKDNEAVANVARFEAMGKRKTELATLDYEAKMTAIFAECRRVLRDDGVMTVMFTHKRAEAWDTLGQALLQAGFTIETSWPVNTERERSLHQVDLNAAASTIMLVCRKRDDTAEDRRVFIDDVAGEIRLAARDAVTRFQADGIDGVDLLLSTYGPVLSVISAHWPVYSTKAGTDGRSLLLRPEEALGIAREEVVRLQRRRLIGREVQVDNLTDFTMIAWQTFKAAEFPFDEARRLALGCGLDIDEVARAKIVEKKSGKVRMLSPKERLRRSGGDDTVGVRLEVTSFDHAIDAVHTVLYIAAIDGMSQAKAFMDRLDLTADLRFVATVQGLVNAIPRAKVKGEWVLPEAGLLDTLAIAYLPDVTLPAEETMPVTMEQLTLDV